MNLAEPGQATIRIKNLRLRTFIGINDEEKQKQQDVIINVLMHYRVDPAIEHNDIDHALNYRTINKAIISHVENGHFLLLEKLVSEVLEIVMRDPKVCHAQVEIDKPHALRFADSVSITLCDQRD
ncbi:dihydroneopterin triphosphate 2'-epimerase [Marinobacterium sp. D7]|uniref:dihydroneopterin triphosphate 2'-epimerase n=1 Tax=Marinobacterium ramblicola TaxID=2849041 RepID=UPI001C2D1781|nr:dihydroneopterin triphosphate 2'-epimerase [Marinobacterium ramblicola]MBV1790234.1 dihydroneopterin triphosphate 2'-epimerase [Marinobacterium ramblicola]